MLLEHVDTKPTPCLFSVPQLLKERGIVQRAESAVRAQLTSGTIAQLNTVPSIRAAAAVIVAINTDGTKPVFSAVPVVVSLAGSSLDVGLEQIG